MDDLFRQVEAIVEERPGRLPPVGLPPVEKWEPAFSGDLDLCIDRNGRWHYEGGPIKRQRLATLFSTILKREGDAYFLVTPVEKWRIEVEDAPFLVVNYQRTKDKNGEQVLQFQTSTDDIVTADRDHPLWVASTADGEARPYLMIRDNMPGLIHRNVFYQLVELALEQGGEENGKLYLESAGQRFALHENTSAKK